MFGGHVDVHHGDGVQAIVTESVYHGQMVRYHLRLLDGREIVAVAADVIPRFRPDTLVRVTWRPEDVWVVPEDGGSPSNHRPRPGVRYAPG